MQSGWRFDFATEWTSPVEYVLQRTSTACRYVVEKLVLKLAGMVNPHVLLKFLLREEHQRGMISGDTATSCDAPFASVQATACLWRTAPDHSRRRRMDRTDRRRAQGLSGHVSFMKCLEAALGEIWRQKKKNLQPPSTVRALNAWQDDTTIRTNKVLAFFRSSRRRRHEDFVLITW